MKDRLIYGADENKDLDLLLVNTPSVITASVRG